MRGITKNIRDKYNLGIIPIVKPQLLANTSIDTASDYIELVLDNAIQISDITHIYMEISESTLANITAELIINDDDSAGSYYNRWGFGSPTLADPTNVLPTTAGGQGLKIDLNIMYRGNNNMLFGFYDTNDVINEPIYILCTVDEITSIKLNSTTAAQMNNGTIEIWGYK